MVAFFLFQNGEDSTRSKVVRVISVPEGREAEGAPGQDNCDIQLAPQEPDTVGPPSGPLRTCGPLTDEDVVRLRPHEKRRVCVMGPL